MKRKSSHNASAAHQQPGSPPRLPLGMKLLVGFFALGTGACAVTIAALLFPDSALDSVWRLNPEARAAFVVMGRPLALLLMAVVGTACAGAAWGLALGREWGRRLAVGILVVNLAGDSINAFAFRDPRTLIGLPIAAALIFYLLRRG